MAEQPTIETMRLRLRPLSLDDVGDLVRLAGDRALAETTLRLPHPYEERHAIEWITNHPTTFEAGEGAWFGIIVRTDSTLVGTIGLTLEAAHERAEMAYMIGKPFWGRGYATEAARAVLGYAFDTLELQRVFAYCFHTNPASGRVLEKIGMRYEGCLRRHIKKWDNFVDYHCYAILAEEYASPTDDDAPDPTHGAS